MERGPAIDDEVLNTGIVLFAKIDPARLEFWAICGVGPPEHRLPFRIGNSGQKLGQGLAVKFEDAVLLLPLIAHAARAPTSIVQAKRLLETSGSCDRG